MSLALSYNNFVRRLDLTSNFLDNDACYHIGQLLSVNTTLQELILSGCKYVHSKWTDLTTSSLTNKFSLPTATAVTAQVLEVDFEDIFFTSGKCIDERTVRPGPGLAGEVCGTPALKGTDFPLKLDVYFGALF